MVGGKGIPKMCTGEGGLGAWGAYGSGAAPVFFKFLQISSIFLKNTPSKIFKFLQISSNFFKFKSSNFFKFLQISSNLNLQKSSNFFKLLQT